MRRRHNAQAAVVLERAARLEPGNGSIVEALARAYYNSGQHVRAADVFGELLEIDPSAAYGHYGLGQALKQVGRRDEARPICGSPARWRLIPRSTARPWHGSGQASRTGTCVRIGWPSRPSCSCCALVARCCRWGRLGARCPASALRRRPVRGPRNGPRPCPVTARSPAPGRQHARRPRRRPPPPPRRMRHRP